MAGHHTYFAGELPVWVHNDGLDDCGELGAKLTKAIIDQGDNPADYFKYLLEVRKSSSAIIDDDVVWGRGFKRMTGKMVDAFGNNEITDVDLLPTVNKIRNAFDETTQLRKIAKADTQVHHIVPEAVVKMLRKLGLPELPANYSLGDVPGVALSIADHDKITRKLNGMLLSKKFRDGSATQKALDVVQWYRDNQYHAQANVALAWFQKKSIL